MQDVVYILIIAALTIALFLLWLKTRGPKEKESTDRIQIFASELFEEKIKEFMNIASLSFKEREERVQTVFEQIHAEIKDHRQYVDTIERERAKTFTELQKDLKASTELTERLRTSTEKLHSILSNSRLRGDFGQQIAEDILRAGGLLEGTHYHKQKQQETIATRPDFVFLLPDGYKINMDVKFPLDNFSRMIEFQDWETAPSGEGERYKRAFLQDIKQKIKDVTSRDYINPNENTLDFVILFIPNERIASYVHESFPEIFTLAVSHRVMLASPYNLISFVIMVQRAFQNFYQREHIRDILLLIGEFGSRYQLFKKRFAEIGDRIEKTKSSYEEVEEKSFKMLDATMKKIEKNQQGTLSEQNEQKQLDD